MKTLYLLRGLPSAGKSSLAKTMGVVNFEADMFFMEGNEYKFDPTKLKQAHQWCQNQVEITMKLSDNVIGDKRITVSNTFTQEWEMKPYYELAEKYDFMIFSIIVEKRHQGTNQHNVPEDKLEIMKKRFEIKL
jgi:predicted kinase